MTPQQLIDEGKVPSWVRYLAQDSTGDWYGFQATPYISEVPVGFSGGRIEIWEAPDNTSFVYIASDKSNPDWKDTLFCIQELAA